MGFEALLRWQHPVRGFVSPAEFVPLAEEVGLIHEIGEWVVRTAIRDCARWPAAITVAVNISPVQLHSPSLPAMISNALHRRQAIGEPAGARGDGIGIPARFGWIAGRAAAPARAGRAHRAR